MFVRLVSLIIFLTLIGSRSALDNGLARTPPMGWISWERFTCQTDCYDQPDDCINEKLYKEMADKLVEGGYAAVGYKYINIDDCWSEKQRDTESDNLVPHRQRFPNGMRNLADYIHSKDLKIGIYGDCGTKTCAGYPAQLKPNGINYLLDNYYETDAKQFNEWQIDSFKFDGCNINPDKAESICPPMERAINKTNRPILITCEWPFYMLRERPHHKEPDYKITERSCNLWRYYEDVEDSWLSVLSIVDFTVSMQVQIFKNHGPGAWFDPDQLVIGNFALSLDQARAQMAIWSIWSAPLFMSNDLRNINPNMAAVLKNEKVIAVDQDALGIFGLMVKQVGQVQVFVKPILPIRNGCPSFSIVVLSRETLGNSKLHSFRLRDLLNSISFKAVRQQYEKAHGVKQPFGIVDEVACHERMSLAMTREPNNPPEGLVKQPTNQKPRSPPVQETVVYYDVEDLFNEGPEYHQKLGLDSNLELYVNPSGVRMVRLIETV